MAGPIKPHEVTKQGVIPEPVFTAFNNLISRHWDGSQATFTQNEVVEAITKVMAIERHEVFDRSLLDVESEYRKAGWIVEYDKPGYNETYPATFTFKRPSSGGGPVIPI